MLIGLFNIWLLYKPIQPSVTRQKWKLHECRRETVQVKFNGILHLWKNNDNRSSYENPKREVQRKMPQQGKSKPASPVKNPLRSEKKQEQAAQRNSTEDTRRARALTTGD